MDIKERINALSEQEAKAALHITMNYLYLTVQCGTRLCPRCTNTLCKTQEEATCMPILLEKILKEVRK